MSGRYGWLSLFALVAGLPDPVWAAQAPTACAVHISPPSGSTIPASAPALHYVVVASGPNAPPASAPKGVQLLSQAGAALAVTVRDDPYYGYRIDLSEKPLEGASYKLRYPDPCVGPAAFGEATITFGPDVPLPTKTPSVGVQPLTRDVRYVCRGEPYVLRSHPSLDVQIGVDSEWAPFLPVMMVETLVDGLVWSRGAYGDLMNDAIPTSGALIQRAADTLYPACGRPGQGNGQNECPLSSLGLSEGQHQLEVKLRVLGSASEPAPVARTFDIGCAGLGPPGTGGAAPGTGGAPVGGTGGAGASKTGGCAVARGATPATGLAPLLAIFVLGLHRRSRVRPLS